MKNVIMMALVLVGLGVMNTGCSQKSVDIPNEDPNKQLAKMKELPSWVLNDEGLSAVGSATYKGQSFIQQRNQAQASAVMNLGRKVKMKVDSLVRDYFRSTGTGTGSNVMLEELGSQTTSQVSSQILSGVYIKNTFVASDGEMFVQVAIDPETVEQYYQTGSRLQKFIFQQLSAKKAFEELKSEVKEYKAETNSTF